MKHKHSHYLMFATALFLLGLIAGFGISGQVNNIDKYHWLLLSPMPFAIIGVYLGVRGFIKNQAYWKFASLLIVLCNLGLAAVAFVTYSFSYWEF